MLASFDILVNVTLTLTRFEKISDKLKSVAVERYLNVGWKFIDCFWVNI